MPELKEVLEEIEASGRGLELVNSTINKSCWSSTKSRMSVLNESAIELTGKSYYVALLWINQGFHKDFGKLPLIKILPMLNAGISLGTMQCDYKKAKESFGVQDLVVQTNAAKPKVVGLLPGQTYRPCLGCEKDFPSWHIGHRRCDNCKKNDITPRPGYNKIGKAAKRRPTLPRKLTKIELEYENVPSGELALIFHKNWKKPSTLDPLMSTTTYR